MTASAPFFGVMGTVTDIGLPWARRSAGAALRAFTQPLPKLRSTRQQLTAPTLYFPTPDYDVPAGGIRVVYRHVDVLNDAGVPAAVLHRRSSFRCSWFANTTRIAAGDSVRLGPSDVAVVGELATGLLDSLPTGRRFVVFNQNPHLTWREASDARVGHYLGHPDLAALLTVSDHSVDVLRYMAPAARILRVHNSIDPTVFFPGARAEPTRTIAFMPRRGSSEARQVLGMLSARGVLDGWQVIALEGLTEAQVADRLRTASIFLSFAYQEGFGLPAAEAMACGCHVVGFHGFSGREFLHPEFSSPVAPGDILGMARAVERVVGTEQATPGWCRASGARAAQFVAQAYSPAIERRDIVHHYTSILAPSASDAPAALAIPPTPRGTGDRPTRTGASSTAA